MSFPLKRFFSYLVLYSFFFQTLWPSVVWAEVLLSEIPSHHPGIKRHSLSLGVLVDDKVDEREAIPFARAKTPQVKVDFNQGVENLRVEVQKSLDIQSLYPGLQVTEKGLSWSSLGVSFLMNYQGTLLVSGSGSREEQSKNPILRLFNPHGDIILGEGLLVNHIQARAKNVLHQGDSRIENLEIWAQGGRVVEEGSERTAEKGKFKIALGSTLVTKFLTLHEGTASHKGRLSLLANGVLDGKGNTVKNKGILDVGTGVKVRNVSDFQNRGNIQGSGLTLEQTVLNNTDTIVLDDLSTLGGAFYNNSKVTVKRWRQGNKTFVNALGATFTVEDQSTFGAGDVKNKGKMILGGDARGLIERFLTEGSLTMGSVSGLSVRTFTNTGNFEVLGPMTWTGTQFTTTKSAIFKGKSQLTVSNLETQGVFSALDDFTLNGNWDHQGGVATLSKVSSFNTRKLTSKGILNILGESRGTIDTFINEGSLTMGSVAGLQVRDFTSPGDFEVEGPMTWFGSSFKTAKTTFKGKTSITAPAIQTTGPLTAASDLSLTGNWAHKIGKAKIANLALKGKSFANEDGATVTVTGSSTVDLDQVHNKGSITLEGPVQGRIDTFVNQGQAKLKGDAKITGKTFVNEKDFDALAIFDWIGETFENHSKGRLTLFDNRVVATRQVINQGLLLWTHNTFNTFRTWHFLNMGWAEVTQNLLTTALPPDWEAPTDTSTTFKKSLVENRGVLKLSPSDYTPRMTIEHSGDFAHWSNTGKMQLPKTHLQAETFKNDGELAVDGNLTGHVEAFESTQKALFKGTVNLTGKTFSTTGGMTFAKNTTLKMDTLTTGGGFSAQSLTLEGMDWTNKEGAETDIVSLLFKGKSIANDGNLLIHELLGGSSSTGQLIALLRNGSTRSSQDEKKMPLFRIFKGGASFVKTTNYGKLVLEGGRYGFQDLINSGILEAYTFLPEGIDTFTLQGKITAKLFCTSAFRGTKIINNGDTTFASTSFRTQTFENRYGALLMLFGYGTANIGRLDNSGTISLNERADMKVETLNNRGTIESSKNILRFIMLDDGQSPESASYHPTIIVRKGGASIDTGTLKAKENLFLEIAASLNPAAYLLLYGDKWQCEGTLHLYGDTFWAKWNDKYAGAMHIKVKHFQNPGSHLIARSLKIEADRFENGLSNTQMGFLETQPDVKKPDADTSLEIIVKGDVDNRYGKIFGHGETTLRSTEGDVLSGESIQKTQSKPAWESSISFPYHHPNESFIASNKDITLQGRHVFLKLAQVKASHGHLYLMADESVRSLASDVYAKAGITINGIRFDNEIFASLDWYPAPRTQNHTPGNEHMKYDYREQPQRSRPSSLRSLGTIRFNTQITRCFGSEILASKSLIDKKGKRWRGKTTSTSRAEDLCDFIAYETQSLPTGWQEFSDRDGWSRYHNGGANSVPSIVEAGEDIKAETSHFRNTGSLSSVTFSLSAGGAAFKYMGAPAKAALQMLVDLGVLSVRYVVEPDITEDGLVTKQPDGTVRQKGTLVESKQAIPSNRLPIIGQGYLGAPSDTKMYITISCEMEKLQQMMAYTMGRLYDQGLSGEALFDEYVREGQRQGERGALVDIRQNQSNKAFLAWALEKAKNAKTEEEALIAVMHFFVPEALRYSGRTGEARTQKRLEIETDHDLDLEGAKLRSEEDKVKASVGGDLNAAAHVTTHGAYENFYQTAQPTEIQAPKDSVEMVMEGDVNVSGIDVLAEKHIGIKGKKFTGKATRLESHSVVHHGKKKTTTHTVHHEVDKYRTTGVGSTIDLMSEEAPFHEEAPVILTGPGGKTTIEAPGISVADVHDETRTESVEKQSSGGLFGGSSTVRDSEHSVRSRGAEFNNILELIDTTSKTGITLVGADCSKVTKAVFDCEEGLISLKAGINAYMKFHSEEDKSAVWQSYEHEMSSSKTYTPCVFSPTCEFEIKSKIPVLVEQVRGQTLHWLEPLRKNLEKNGGTINLQELDEIYKHESVAQAGPTAAASLVIAMAITIATYGSGAAAWAGGGISAVTGATGTTAVIVSEMGAAAFAALCSQAAIAIIENPNDFGKAFKQLGSSRVIKDIACCAATAGLMRGIGQALNVPVHAYGTTGIVGHLKHQALQMSVRTGVQTAAGQKLDKALEYSLRGAIAGVVGGLAANHISDAYYDKLLNVFTHKLAHLGLGAGLGAILGGKKGIVAGAIGAVVAESMADIISEDSKIIEARVQENAKTQGIPLTDQERLSPLIYDEVRARLDISKLGGAMAGLLAGQDVCISAATATIAVESNFAKMITKKVLKYLAKKESKQAIKQSGKEVAKEGSKKSITSGYSKKQNLTAKQKEKLQGVSLRGENPRNVHLGKKGEIKVHTELLGGEKAARKMFEEMSGQKLAQNAPNAIGKTRDGSEIFYRSVGDSGHPKIEIKELISGTSKVKYEKITFRD